MSRLQEYNLESRSPFVCLNRNLALMTGIAGEEFVNFAQENVEADALSRGNAQGVCLGEEACAGVGQIDLVVNLESGFR